MILIFREAVIDRFSFLCISKVGKFATTFAVLIFAAGQANAAPLDALLTAKPFHQAGDLAFELGYDAMNNTLDVFGVRAQDAQYAGTNVGDYAGVHLRAGFALTDHLSLDGGYAKRKITYRPDTETLESWQAAVQYHLYGDDNSAANYAVRLGIWGNQTGELRKTSPTSFMGKTLNSLSLSNPQDAQIQFDTLGSWKIAEQTELSAFVGAGSSWVATGNMTASYTNGSGCIYNITFSPEGTTGELASPCATSIVITNFSTSDSFTQELTYRSSYYQLGGMVRWHQDNLTLRGGYQFQNLNRGSVDTLISSGGGTVYRINHIIVADVSYQLAANAAVFIRGQVMSNQFVGEIPFAYNSITASKFSRQYGFASVGVNFIY